MSRDKRETERREGKVRTWQKIKKEKGKQRKES